MASAMASAMASDAASRAPPGMKHKMAMSHEERLAEGSRYKKLNVFLITGEFVNIGFFSFFMSPQALFLSEFDGLKPF